MDAAALRAEFPGLADRAYLNAGTFGPVPRGRGQRRARRHRARRVEGRVDAYFDAMMDLRDRLRAAYAARLERPARGRRADDLAPARASCACWPGMDFAPGDEILTAARRAPRPARPAR